MNETKKTNTERKINSEPYYLPYLNGIRKKKQQQQRKTKTIKVKVPLCRKTHVNTIDMCLLTIQLYI